MNITAIINSFNLSADQFQKLTNQHLHILWFIYQVGSITPMEAFSELGITKLATRISEMKALGIQFSQNYEGRENRFGKKVRYMRYGRAAA